MIYTGGAIPHSASYRVEPGDWEILRKIERFWEMGFDCMAAHPSSFHFAAASPILSQKFPISALSRHSPQGEDGRTHKASIPQQVSNTDKYCNCQIHAFLQNDLISPDIYAIFVQIYYFFSKICLQNNWKIRIIIVTRKIKGCKTEKTPGNP